MDREDAGQVVERYRVVVHLAILVHPHRLRGCRWAWTLAGAIAGIETESAAPGPSQQSGSGAVCGKDQSSTWKSGSAGLPGRSSSEKAPLVS